MFLATAATMVTFSISKNGGTGPFTYKWTGTEPQPIDNGQDAQGLYAGTYHLRVTDANGCVVEIGPIEIEEPPLLTASISDVEDADCAGNETGSAKANGAGGTPGYTYLWSNGQTSQTATGLTAGGYAVTITDDNGCTAVAAVTISDPNLLVLKIEDIEDVSCYDGDDGSVDVSVIGGTPPYIFTAPLSSTGPTTATAEDLEAGTYLFMVTDANGCQAMATATVDEPTKLIAEIVAHTDVTCEGEDDGTATVNATGGTTPYSYLWDNGSTTATATLLTPGIHTVTVTDANDCTATTTVIIEEPDELELQLEFKTDVSCYGGSDGFIYVQTIGGTAPYNYVWTGNVPQPIDNAEDAQNISAGSYSLLVVDANGCQASLGPITIDEPTLLTASISDVEDADCAGNETGSAKANGAGGTPGYTYLWSNGQTSQTATGLTAGGYAVTITDDNGCTTVAAVTISDPNLIVLKIEDIEDVSCYDGDDGSVDVSVIGGTPPYIFTAPLSSTGPATATADDLEAGTYLFMVTDANGCQAMATATVGEPTKLIAEIVAHTDVTCEGEDDGTATVNATGGTTPYSYLWDNGSATATATLLTPGVHTVTVTDANDCTATTTVIIEEPDELELQLEFKTDVSCYGGSDGYIFVRTDGGTGPFNYVWIGSVPQPIDNAEDAQNIGAGTYTLYVTDANGCEASLGPIEIDEPTLLQASISNVIDADCLGNETGSATANGSGGTPGYTYAWSNGQTNQTATNLTAGGYNVTITDANGCTAVAAVTISDPNLLVLKIEDITNASCNGYDDGSVLVSVIGGTPPYNFTQPLTAIDPDEARAEGLEAGTYLFMVQDANGCIAMATATVDEPTLLIAEIIDHEDVSCEDEDDGTATVNATGGTTPYTYEWDNGSTSHIATGLTPGVHTVTVTDANDCEATAEVIIEEPDELIANLSSTINVSCYGGSDGYIFVSLNGGTGPFTYKWSGTSPNPIDDAQDAQNIGAGTYSLKVTDANGCVAELDDIEITEPPLLTASISDIVDSDCAGNETGSAKANGNGGTGDYTYAWSNGQTTQTATDLAAGGYNVTITDENGCTAVAAVTISDPSGLVLVIDNVTNETCNESDDGSISVFAIGGTSPYTFELPLVSTGANNAEATGLAAGTYLLKVTDANGCEAVVTTVVDQPTELLAEIISQVDETCNGANDGSATVNATGGTTPYSYQWSASAGSQTSFTATSLPAGMHTVTVTDANDCTYEVSVVIGQGQSFDMDDFADLGPLCPDVTVQNILISSLPPLPNATYTWTGGAAVGLADGNTTGLTPYIPSFTTTTAADPSDYPIVATITVTGTVNGCTDVETFTITIDDYNSLAFVNCPPDIVVNNDPDLCGANVNWSDPIASDNCTAIGGIIITQTDGSGLSSGDFFPVGTTAIQYTADDGNGNTITCDFNIVVADAQIPNAVCKDIVVQLDADGEASITAADIDGGSSDNCNDIDISITDNDFTCADLGANMVVLVVEDDSGNTAICQSAVLVVDEIAPTFTCPASPMPVPGCDGLVPDIISGILDADDNCGPVTLSQNPLPGVSIGNNGGNSVDVVITATDPSGNSTSCTVTVEIVDDLDPYFVNCPAGITVSNDPDQCSAIVNWPDPVAMDNCDPLAVMQIDGPSSGVTIQVGDIQTVIYEATDGSGNTITCEFDIQVVDTQKPEFATTMPLDETVECDAIPTAFVFMPMMHAYDNCTDPEDITFTFEEISDQDPDPTTCEHYTYLIQRIWTITDEAGNSRTYTQKVYVEDTTDPTFTVPADIVLECDEDQTTTVDDASDNCADESVLSIVSNDVSTQSSDPSTCEYYNYTITRTWTVTDPCGNSSMGDQIIDVEDTTAPVVNCQDITVQLDQDGNAVISANDVNAGSTDNCAALANLTITVDQSQFTCDDLGDNVVTLTVSDPCGNSSSCEATVTVEDNIVPIITCPSDITINLDPGACEAKPKHNASVIDNCPVDIVSVPPSGTFLPIGVHTIVYTATDEAGNTATCSFDITVVEYPATNYDLVCNDFVQVSLDASCEAEINADMILEGTGYGCYDDFEITVSQLNGFPVPTSPIVTSDYIGQTLIVMVYDPDSGNTCWGQILIEDKLAPEIECAPDMVLSCTASPDSAYTGVPQLLSCEDTVTITYVDEFFDNGCASIALDIIRTWTFTDGQGNASSCVQTLSFEKPSLSEVEFPGNLDEVSGNALSCKDVLTDPSLPHPNKEGGWPMIDGMPIVAGSVCNISIGYSDAILEICQGGYSYEILRTWTVRDMCLPLQVGVNPIQYIQSIKVLDMTGPDINCPPTATVSTSGISCESYYVLPNIDIIDDCSGVDSFIVSGPIGAVDTTNIIRDLALGVHEINYVAFDLCGNISNCTTLLTVEDASSPTTICDEITDVNIPNIGNAIVFAETFDDGSHDDCCLDRFEVRKMTDECGISDNLTFGPSVEFCCEDVSNSPIMVVFRAVDCFGNSNECMVEVIVNDKTPSILVSCPANERVSCDWYASQLETQLANAAPEDQCDILDQYFGDAEYADNCVSNVTCTVSFNLDQCLEGNIRRTWVAVDSSGNTNSSQNCNQTIFVDQVSDFVVEFPQNRDDDLIGGHLPAVECGTDVPDFGEPEIFYETCELVAVSYEDEIFTDVDSACYKIAREWTVINWCVVGDEIDQEVEEDSELELRNAGCLTSINLECDLDGDGDCDDRTFRDSWAICNLPDAAHANENNDPDTDPDSDPWDGFIQYTQIIKVKDSVDPVFSSGCDIPDVCITDNTCSVTFTLPTPDIDECSSFVTFSVTGDLGTGFGPFGLVSPGEYDVRFVAMDNCNNQTACETTVKVVDCKKPTPYCKNGLIVELMPVIPPMVEVWAADLNDSSFDNCPGDLVFSFAADTSETSIIYGCDNVGQNEVDIWVTDASGNQDFCTTEIIIQDNMDACDDSLSVYLGGVIETEDNEGVKDVNVQLSGSGQMSVMTDVNGSFTIPVSLGGDYSITPLKDDDHLNGVTTYDLVLITKHILGAKLLDTPYKMVAADANKSGTITTFDLVQIRKLILYINDIFPSNTSWRFIEKDYTFPNTLNPWQDVFPEVTNFNNVTQSVLNADFVAVKIGDVNGNAETNFVNNGNDDRNMVGSLVFGVDELRLKKGKTYTVAFKATDFNVLGYQFTMNYDLDKVEFMDVVPAIAEEENFGLSLLDKGVITASWNKDNVKLAGKQVIFSLVFKAKQNVNLEDAININSRYTVAEAYRQDGELLDVEMRFTGTNVAMAFELYQNTPNPFTKQTIIGFRLPDASAATLTIMDVSGKVVKTVRGNYQKGYNEITVNRRELPSNGVFYYQLDTDKESATKMMLLMD